jgi:hypothetical protein
MEEILTIHFLDQRAVVLNIDGIADDRSLPEIHAVYRHGVFSGLLADKRIEVVEALAISFCVISHVINVCEYVF